MLSYHSDGHTGKAVNGGSFAVLSSGTARKVDDACRQFEAFWKRGNVPTIEEHLNGFTQDERPFVFSCLLRLELRLRLGKGELPKAADYADRFSDYTDAISQVFSDCADGGDVTQTWNDQLRHQQASASPMPKIGDFVDRFEVRGVLGEGGFGTVFRAYDPQLERDVAIKIPRSLFWRTSEQRQDILDEARAAALLTHPNVCPIYEVGVERGRLYIVMARIDGQPLSQLMAEEAVSDENSIVLLIRQVALTMEEAHVSGAVHRDLKPANILIDNRGTPILTDFGLAQRGRPGGIAEDLGEFRVGTTGYMSPEQVCGDSIGPTSDIYSLGVIFYELLTGRRPFVGTKVEVIKQILDAEPPAPSTYRTEIDPRTESICLKALKKNPADRFESMQEMAKALDEVLKSADPVELLSHVDSAMLTLTSVHMSSANVAKTARAKPNNRTWRRALLACLVLLFASALSGTAFFVARNTRSAQTDESSLHRSPDLDVANWLAGMGVPFEVLLNGQTLTVSGPNEVPEEFFHVVRIDLTHQPNLRDEHLARLQGLENLQALLLHDTSITDAALVHIQDLESLQVLWLDRTQVTDRGLVCLKNLRNLESLSLNDTAVTGSGLSYVADHPRLIRLSLKRSHVDDQRIQGVGNLSSLTHLWLDGTQVTDKGFESLAGLENLVVLNASDLKVEGPGLCHLSGLTQLEELALKRTRLHDEGMQKLGAFPALTHFYADETQMGNEGLSVLVDAAPNLVRLSLGRTRVGSVGLANLARLPKLEILTLDRLKINRNSLEVLTSLGKLRSLSLQSARIGDVHAPALSKLTQLEQLFLGGTRLSREQRELLKVGLPNCEIR